MSDICDSCIHEHVCGYTKTYEKGTIRSCIDYMRGVKVVIPKEAFKDGHCKPLNDVVVYVSDIDLTMV